MAKLAHRNSDYKMVLKNEKRAPSSAFAYFKEKRTSRWRLPIDIQLALQISITLFPHGHLDYIKWLKNGFAYCF